MIPIVDCSSVCEIRTFTKKNTFINHSLHLKILFLNKIQAYIDCLQP